MDSNPQWNGLVKPSGGPSWQAQDDWAACLQQMLHGETRYTFAHACQLSAPSWLSTQSLRVLSHGRRRCGGLRVRCGRRRLGCWCCGCRRLSCRRLWRSNGIQKVLGLHERRLHSAAGKHAAVDGLARLRQEGEGRMGAPRFSHRTVAAMSHRKACRLLLSSHLACALGHKTPSLPCWPASLRPTSSPCNCSPCWRHRHPGTEQRPCHSCPCPSARQPALQGTRGAHKHGAGRRWAWCLRLCCAHSTCSACQDADTHAHSTRPRYHGTQQRTSPLAFGNKGVPLQHSALQNTQHRAAWHPPRQSSAAPGCAHLCGHRRARHDNAQHCAKLVALLMDVGQHLFRGMRSLALGFCGSPETNHTAPIIVLMLTPTALCVLPSLWVATST